VDRHHWRQTAFGNILQLFRGEFTTFGRNGITVQQLLRMTKRQTMEEFDEQKGSCSGAG
jgi:hypothetical protein